MAQIKLRKITSLVLEEGGDEIFLKVQSNGSTKEVRPSGSPDYWRFDKPNVSRSMNKHVATIGAGQAATITLMEQDGVFDADDRLGKVDVLVIGTGVTFAPVQNTEYLGMGSDGFHTVLFKKGARYKVKFSAE